MRHPVRSFLTLVVLVFVGWWIYSIWVYLTLVPTQTRAQEITAPLITRPPATTVVKVPLGAAHYRYNGTTELPDRTATPGQTDPLAVADITGTSHITNGVERNVCAKDFRTPPIRKMITNFAGLKAQACKEYNVTPCDKSVEGDHLISIELGGCPYCLGNIWPQEMDQARIKDHQVEDVLPKLICSGKMTLSDAQQCIADDWVACAVRIKTLQ
jgi:hypothetical protein